MPYITEEIWQRVAPLAGIDGDTIMVQPFPIANPALEDASALNDLEWMKEFIVGIRNIRGEMDISPSKPLNVLLKGVTSDDQRRLDDNQAFLQALAKLESITQLNDGDEAPASATAIVGSMEILIPMAGLIDTAAELTRIAKALEKVEKDLARTSGKLSNERFVSKAPAEVIEKERAKMVEMEQTVVKLKEQRTTIEAL